MNNNFAQSFAYLLEKLVKKLQRPSKFFFCTTKLNKGSGVRAFKFLRQWTIEASEEVKIQFQ